MATHSCDSVFTMQIPAMTPSSNHSISFQLTISDRAIAAVSQLLGPPIELWVLHQHQWQHAVNAIEQNLDVQTLEHAVIDPKSVKNLTFFDNDPTFVELSTGLFRVGLWLTLLPKVDSEQAVKVYILGTVRTSPQNLVATILRISQERDFLEREAAEFRLGLGPHLEQISYNFEELSYFRRLGQQIELRDVADPLADLAERLLSDLCPLIQATGLGFLTHLRPQTKQGTLVAEAGRIVAWSGLELLNAAQCAEFIALKSDQFHDGETIVQNQVQSDPRYHAFAEIHSFIQVPVSHHGTQFGWLLALNRIPWRDRSTLPADSVPIGVSDNEFGTVEASLMASAASTLAAHYRNTELFREKEQLLIGVVRALINAIDAKDSYTCGHSDRVAVFAKCIGEQLGLDARQCEHLYMSGLLHDLGKIGIPDHVLCKPGKLTDEEFAVIRQHPSIGHAILNHLPQLHHILPGVLHHHESVNGKGYPAGLSEQQIPLFARILAVADSYDAMTSARPYRSAMSVEKAISILTDGAGSQWDREIVDAFLKARPAIELACQQSDEHLKELLQNDKNSANQNQSPVADAITRAVSAIRV